MAFSFSIPSHSHKFQSHPIPTPVKQLFPFPLFSHIDIPIPSHSHSWLPYINDCVEQLMEIVATLSLVSYSTIVLATQIHETILTQFTIVLQKKATNKEHNVWCNVI